MLRWRELGGGKTGGRAASESQFKLIAWLYRIDVRWNLGPGEARRARRAGLREER